MQPPSIDTHSLVDDPRSPSQQLEEVVRGPHSDQLRRKFFGILAALDGAADVEPWIRAAHELRASGIIDDDGLVYFAAMFLECLTQGDAVSDPDLVRIQDNIDALDRQHDANDAEGDVEVDDLPEMQALYAAYDARARVVETMCLRGLGYDALADQIERDYDWFMGASEIGAGKIFDDE
ncbi:MAG: hypothetical protein ACREOG_07395 [Gemmatimonadaceae bacterium]